MLTIFIRTIIIYVILIVTMRLMGKRQLSELQLSELVTAFLLSEIASLPITNSEIPMSYALVPIIALMSFEIIMSIIILKCPKIKKILTSRPAVIISKGKFKRDEMEKVRISVDEIVSQIRQNGIYSLDEVDYAILEENGKISVIPKSCNRPPDCKTLNIECDDSGIMHIIVSDGAPNQYNLSLLEKDEVWLEQFLLRHNTKLSDALCMTADDCGNIIIVKNDGSLNRLREKI